MNLKEANVDLAEVLAQFTNLILNERVKSYNEGVDDERARCVRAAAAVMKIDPAHAEGPLFDALRCEPDDCPTASIVRGAELLRELYST